MPVIPSPEQFGANEGFGLCLRIHALQCFGLLLHKIAKLGFVLLHFEECCKTAVFEKVGQRFGLVCSGNSAGFRALGREPLRTGRILNINVPDLPLDEIKGIRVTRCGSRHPADQVIPQQDPRGNTLYWIGPPGDKCDAGPDTDFAAVDEGYVSVTPLHVDLTAYSAHDVVSGWLDRAGVNAQW